MKFKHSFHVFVDNFSVTYKHLLYRLAVLLIAGGLIAAIAYPFVNGLTGSAQYQGLLSGVKAFLKNLVEGHPAELGEATEQIKESFTALLEYIAHNKGNLVWGILGVVLVYLVQKFFSGLGNYAMSAVINDKMAFHAQSPYLVTLIKNLKESCLYNLMYVPLTYAYDALCYTGLYFLTFKAMSFLYFPLRLFLFVTLAVLAVSFKMVFTSDWLPALIRGKCGQKKAFLYTFDRRGKNTFNVLSNYVVIVLIIFVINVGAIIFTCGAAALITVPSSYAILVCFQLVNYYDREELKYFLDRDTIIKPRKERTLTREEFFKGE